VSTQTICVARRRFGLDLAVDVRVRLRWLLPRDLPAVLEIEAKSFAFPWSEDDFMRCLRHAACVCMVAECGDRVAGFLVYELKKDRIRIFNLAVAPSYRRCGVATQMIKNLTDKPSLQSRRWVSLGVRETNLAAQLFLRARGFRAVSILRQFYTETSEDAYLMRFRYPSPTRGKSLPNNAEAPRRGRWEDLWQSVLRLFRRHDTGVQPAYRGATGQGAVEAAV
jgi:ribosomal-protein-alanine N-acetyltransferase